MSRIASQRARRLSKLELPRRLPSSNDTSNCPSQIASCWMICVTHLIDKSPSVFYILSGCRYCIELAWEETERPPLMWHLCQCKFYVWFDPWVSPTYLQRGRLNPKPWNDHFILSALNCSDVRKKRLISFMNIRGGALLCHDSVTSSRHIWHLTLCVLSSMMVNMSRISFFDI